MRLIDTHTHLYLPAFRNDRDEMIRRAVSSGVEKLLMPNIDVPSIEPMLSATENYQGICYPMIGLHPTSVKDDFLLQLDEIEKTASQHKFIAIGEIGIDLYWDKTRLAEQTEAFRRQVAFAINADLPVVIHSRNSINEVFGVLEEFAGSGLKGVFHAYSSDLRSAKKVIGMGFLLGVGGVLTYKNSILGSICKEVGPQHIVLETDSPYLTPVPYRGKRNESSYICIINKKLAEILEMSEEETASITFENSCRLFNL
jgi:TatD DNase family protein